MRRLKLIVKLKLDGRNKIKAINTWAVSLLRYGAGIMKTLNETYLQGELKFDCNSISIWSGTKSREKACTSSQASVFKVCETPKKIIPMGRETIKFFNYQLKKYWVGDFSVPDQILIELQLNFNSPCR